jgi:hypothetical protein
MLPPDNALIIPAELAEQVGRGNVALFVGVWLSAGEGNRNVRLGEWLRALTAAVAAARPRWRRWEHRVSRGIQHQQRLVRRAVQRLAQPELRRRRYGLKLYYEYLSCFE